MNIQTVQDHTKAEALISQLTISQLEAVSAVVTRALQLNPGDRANLLSDAEQFRAPSALASQ